MILRTIACAALLVIVPGALVAQDSLTYSKDVAPIIKKYCLPCHLAENDNPSQLSMDTYDLLMKGGEHGDIVIAGKPEKSTLYIKLLPDPPFGKQMARNRKKLTEQELKTIYTWIKQGGMK